MDQYSADARRIRVVIIDDHEIFRAACRALLQTEGLDIVADLPVDEQAIAVTEAMSPDLVIVDVTPGQPLPVVIAERLRTLPHAPTIVLTSSSTGLICREQLAGVRFVPKADICRERLLRHLRSSTQP
jgi:DNA-binding NarL/FixJ family response regulator